MIHTIPKGSRKPKSGIYGLWIAKKTLQKQVRFHESCKYRAKGFHTLFGIGYFGGDIVSYQWRYESISETIIISTFCNGVIYDIASVRIGEPVSLSIHILRNAYVFVVAKDSGVASDRVKSISRGLFSYPVGPQLSEEAPHDLKLLMTNNDRHI